MNLLDIILLGVLEGLTELLPVSSTGHLILLGSLLGHEGEAAKALDVVIQLGAVAAVAVYFRKRLTRVVLGLAKRDPASRQLTLALLAAFVPTAAVGLLFHKAVKARLFAPTPVAAALIVGGVLMIAVERWHRGKPEKRIGLEQVRVRDGFIIGACQCLSLWPGSSRSMTTIVGGQLLGLDTRTAAEFSFLLAVPTLGAATAYDFYKNGHHIINLPQGATLLAVGTLVSFFVTWLVVAVFLRHVGRVGMTPFGGYRILLGILVLAAL